MQGTGRAVVWRVAGGVHGRVVTEPLVWKGELWLCRLDHHDCILSVTVDIQSMCRGRDGSKPGPALGWAVFCLPPAFLPVTDSYSQTSCFTREHFSVLLKGDFYF